MSSACRAAACTGFLLMLLASASATADELVKATLNVLHGGGGGDAGSVEFQFNPSQVTIEKHSSKPKPGGQERSSEKVDDQASPPWKIHLKNIVFDTYESRENVKTKYIDVMTRYTVIDKKTRKRPAAALKLSRAPSKKTPHTRYHCTMTRLSAKYTKRIEQNVPVRATVDAVLLCSHASR